MRKNNNRPPPAVSLMNGTPPLHTGYDETLAAGTGGFAPSSTQTIAPHDFVATMTQHAVLNAHQLRIQDFDGVDMVYVPAGCFWMGHLSGLDDERPLAEICFQDAFWIDRYEVTNAEFTEHEGGAAQESCFTGDLIPRTCITWSEARDYCASRGEGVRLPTEAEWEYAARGPNSLTYPWGNTFADVLAYAGTVATFNEFGDEVTAPQPIGSFAGGESWVGAEDMSGNVLEWVSTLYEDYPYEDGRENPDSLSRRVARGGAFQDGSPGRLTTTARLPSDPSTPLPFIGFRCARSD
jgi:formylglycine-generating enzyme required for sulfatase activity